MKLKVGDVVIFKDYDKLIEEYGGEHSIGARTPTYSFTIYMQDLCGTSAVVNYIEPPYDKYPDIPERAKIGLESFTAECRTKWNYSAAMVRLPTDAELPPKLNWDKIFYEESKK